MNINDSFTFTLTSFGAEVLNEYNAQFNYPPKWAPAIAREGDTKQFPLWEIMQIFGPRIHHGMGQSPFLNNELEPFK